MKTLHLTQEEINYDEALSAAQENNTVDNEEILFLATIALNKARKHDRKVEARVLRHMNKHLHDNDNQGRLPEKTALSERLVAICFFLAGLTLFILWLLRWWTALWLLTMSSTSSPEILGTSSAF